MMKVKFKNAIRPNRKKQLISGGIFLPILLAGFFIPWIGYSILVCMLAGIFISLRNGRAWCDYMCPRGSFLDAYLSSISPQRPVPKWFYSYKFRIVFIAILFSFLIFNIVCAYPNLELIGFAFVKTLLLTTSLSIFLAIFWRARMWCILCPVGTFAGLIGGNKNKLRVDFAKCLNCTNCELVCPMGAVPFQDKEKGELSFRDCLKCGYCVRNCPTGALSFPKKEFKK